MNAKLLNVALAAALGLASSALSYAADTERPAQGTRTAAWSDADVRAALATCDKLTGSERSKCIVNIRPTEAKTPVAMAPAEPTTPYSADPNSVKDGNAVTDAEYSAAVKECESVSGTDKDRCIDTAKEHFGRM